MALSVSALPHLAVDKDAHVTRVTRRVVAATNHHELSNMNRTLKEYLW